MAKRSKKPDPPPAKASSRGRFLSGALEVAPGVRLSVARVPGLCSGPLVEVALAFWLDPDEARALWALPEGVCPGKALRLLLAEPRRERSLARGNVGLLAVQPDDPERLLPEIRSMLVAAADAADAEHREPASDVAKTK